MKANAHDIPQTDAIYKAASVLNSVVRLTALEFNARLSQKYDANILLKREDLQIVRSYKIRGAFNKVSTLFKSAWTRFLKRPLGFLPRCL